MCDVDWFEVIVFQIPLAIAMWALLIASVYTLYKIMTEGN